MNSRLQKKYSDWSEWRGREYLNTYFSVIETDEIATLRYIVTELKKIKEKKTHILEFGSGPIVAHALALVPYADIIDMVDYLDENLSEVSMWLEREPKAFNWNKFTELILSFEGRNTSKKSILEREEQLRKKIKLMRCDARRSPAIIASKKKKYDVILSTYCVDSSTNLIQIWKKYLHNMLSHLANNGHIILASLRKTDHYRVNGHTYPAVNINEKNLINALHAERCEVISLEVTQVPTQKINGFSSIMFAHAIRK